MQTNLSLDQFKASRQFLPKQPIHLMHYPHDEGIDQPVLMYAGECMIGLVTVNWTGKSQLAGKYHLQISNHEWISDDLDALELRLYTDHYLPEHRVEPVVPAEAVDEVIEALSHLWAAAKGLLDAYERFPVLNDVQPEGASQVAPLSFDEWLQEVSGWQDAWKEKFAKQ